MRLVARDYDQKEGKKYFFTYVPALLLNSFRIMLALATVWNLHGHNVDVITANLYAEVDADIYI